MSEPFRHRFLFSLSLWTVARVEEYPDIHFVRGEVLRLLAATLLARTWILSIYPGVLKLHRRVVLPPEPNLCL